MFAVLNKDVKSSAYMSVVVCFLIIPLLANARDLESINTDADSLYCNNDLQGSYEDYITDRSSRIQKTESRAIKNKTNYNKHKSSAHKKISSTRKKNIFICYTVKKKDTLTKIAKKFDITVSAIQKHNRLNDQHTIKSGMVLKIQQTTTAQNATKPVNEPLYEKNGLKPRFRWPVPHIVEYKNDGLDGVKPIGIIITSVSGSKVLSSAPGMIKKIGRMRGFGKYIVINHSGRFNTVYSNLSEILVSEGDSVQSGIIIGRIHSSEKKLHFQIDREGKPENPLKYLPKNI
jgi:lipoprotein NlpD